MIMGHINLSIQQNQQTKWYILSNADFLGEAWLAEVRENDTTKIIKQFQCRKFENCFIELQRFIKKLGKVTRLSANEIKERDLQLLENILIPNEDGILPVNDTNIKRISDPDPFWNWLKNDRYMTL
jgi:hypothetical protein